MLYIKTKYRLKLYLDFINTNSWNPNKRSDCRGIGAREMSREEDFEEYIHCIRDDGPQMNW